MTEDSRVFHSVIAKDPEAWQAVVRETNSTMRTIILHILDLLAGRSKVMNSADRDNGTPHSSGSSSDSDPSSPTHTPRGDADGVVRLESEDGSKGENSKKDEFMDGDVAQEESSDGPVSGKNSQISEVGTCHISPSFGKMGEEIEKLVNDFGMGVGAEVGGG